MGDMNGRLGNNVTEVVVGRWLVEGRKEKGEHQVDVCGEKVSFLANTFEHKLTHRYT